MGRGSGGGGRGSGKSAKKESSDKNSSSDKVSKIENHVAQALTDMGLTVDVSQRISGGKALSKLIEKNGKKSVLNALDSLFEKFSSGGLTGGIAKLSGEENLGANILWAQGYVRGD